MSRRALFTCVFVAVLLGGAAFFWQVFSYYQKIQNGTISTLDLPTSVFRDKLTTSALAEAAFSAAPPSGMLVSETDPTLGSKSPLLTIVEFGDFGCPYSREVSYTVRRIAELFPEKVQLVYRDYPLIDIHPEALLAAEAAACADDQGQFWAYHDILFAHQEDLSREALLTYAASVGLQTQKLESCLNANRHAEEIAGDMADGAALGVLGTPTFFFNGRLVEGAIPEATFIKIVEAFIRQLSDV